VRKKCAGRSSLRAFLLRCNALSQPGNLTPFYGN
jgi:hypothetical protein